MMEGFIPNKPEESGPTSSAASGPEADNAPAKPTGRLVGRNVVASLLARSAEVVFLIVLTPLIVSILGKERYGLFALGILVLQHFLLLDFGITPALMNYLSLARAHNDLESQKQFAGTSTLIYTTLSLVGVLLAFLVSGVLARQIFNVPEEFQGEAVRVFALMGGSGALNTMLGQSHAILLSRHQSYLLNMGLLLGTLVRYGGMTGMLLAGHGLVTAVAVYSGAVGIHLLAMILVSLRVMGLSTLRPRWHRESFLKILGFGTSMGLLSAASQLMLNLDRVMLGFFLPVRQFPFYAVPSSLTSRIGDIPRYILLPVAPALTEIYGTGDSERLRRGYIKASRFVSILCVPLCVLLVLFAPELLRYWVGAEFAVEGAGVMRMLTLGMFWNVAAATPNVLIRSVGRPDIGAKILWQAFALQSGLMVIAVPTWGFSGAALVFALVQALGAASAMAWVSRSTGIISVTAYVGQVFMRPLFISLFVAVVAYPLRGMATGLVSLLCIMGIAVAANWWANVWLVLKADERLVVRQTIEGIRGMLRGSGSRG